MDSTQLATEVAAKVVSDTKFWIAIIGLVGAIIGALLTILGNVILHKLKEKPQKEFDEKRIEMLKSMLDDNRFPNQWRNLSTLAAVIGTDENETKRLLFKAGARGSEKADGKWGLVKNHPLPGPS
ncbi:hypothetical protein [Pseudoalteromonas sp. ASV78]|uniref:hypothetical protein n=1 Tax=Pseudoalteromonas sp. ASV78 TaxID=3397851 RepID=UPI0039FD9BC9